MAKRPFAVTVLSIILILAGAGGLIRHLAEFSAADLIDVAGIAIVCLTAVVSGAFMLRAGNWARWLAIAWMAFHVAISISGTRIQLGLHILFLAVFVYFLFRPSANDYFRTAA